MAFPSLGGEIVISAFSGLNTQDNPAAISDGEAQDLLNVNITPGGKSVFTRDGYGLFKTLTISSTAIHGGYYFQDLLGADIQLWGVSSTLQAIYNATTPVQIATGTLNATWQCADSQGFAYCLNSSRDTAVRTSGTSGTTTFQAGVPKGTMVTFTPDRMVVSGVSGTESALYLSQSNTFTNFTTNVLSPDPFIEYINAPGSRITHIKYACGKLLWWKDGSFGYSVGTDQYNFEDVTISATIGTLDNDSDYYNGHVYFRGQDSHIYDYDCSNVTRLSRKILPTVQAANRRKSNSWTQSTQADWQAGTGIPAANMSLILSTGDVVLSSFTSVDTDSSTFSLGTGTNITFANLAIFISTNNAGNITDNDWEGTLSTNYDASGWVTTASDPDCGATPFSGTRFATTGISAAPITALTFTVLDNNGVGLSSTSITLAATCNWLTQTVAVPGQAGKRVKYQWSYTDSSNHAMITKSTYIYPGTIDFHYRCPDVVGTGNTCNLDLVSGGSSTIATANFTSRSMDSGLTARTAAALATWAPNTGTSYIELQTSADNSVWVPITTATGTYSTAGRRYYRYISSFTANYGDYALSTLNDASVVAISTGLTFQSAVNNAPALTSWSNFTATDQTTGGTISYFTRASTANFIVTSSTPNWVSQTKNSAVSASTGTYFQVRADFVSATSSATLALNDFTVNWFEGLAAEKAYIKYWNDSVWVAVSSGTSGLNNRVIRWDLQNEAWLFDDIGSNGFVVDNGNLYFGSTSAGKVYKYGNNLTTDDSLPITSYWTSKNYSGADPFVQNNFDQMDFIVKASSTTMALSYTLDGSSITAINLPIYNANKTIIHKGINLPGKLGTFFNIKFGATSSNTKYEVLGFRVKYTPNAWRPE